MNELLRGAHFNWPHWRYGPAIYLGARLIGQIPHVGPVRPIAALLVVLAIAVTNDRGDFGDPPMPGIAGYSYAAFEVLNFLPGCILLLVIDLMLALP